MSGSVDEQTFEQQWEEWSDDHGSDTDHDGEDAQRGRWAPFDERCDGTGRSMLLFRPVVPVLIVRREDFLYELKAGPAGGRLRRPSSRRQRHDGHRGAGLTRSASWEPSPPGESIVVPTVEGATVAVAALVRRGGSP